MSVNHLTNWQGAPLKSTGSRKGDNDRRNAHYEERLKAAEADPTGPDAKWLEKERKRSNHVAATVVVAVALARAGFVAQAQALADELAKAHPSNTILNFYWLPTVRVATELHLNHLVRTIEILQAVAPYELGSPPPYPA